MMNYAGALASALAITFALLCPLACSFPGELPPSLTCFGASPTSPSGTPAMTMPLTRHAALTPASPLLLPDLLFLPRISHHLPHCLYFLFVYCVLHPYSQRRLREGGDF